MDSILISGAPILTVYIVDSLPSAPPAQALIFESAGCAAGPAGAHKDRDQHALARPPGVCARTPTPTHRNSCGRRTRSLRSCPALRLLPPALPSSSPSSLFTAVSDRCVCRTDCKNKKGQPSPVPHELWQSFGHTLGVCGDLMTNISANCGRPDMRFVCVEARKEIFHT